MKYRYLKQTIKRFLLPLALIASLAAGCSGQKVSDANDNPPIVDDSNADASNADDSDTIISANAAATVSSDLIYDCCVVEDLTPLFDTVGESEDKYYVCDFTEYSEICDAISVNCAFDNANAKYVVVYDTGYFIESGKPIQYFTNDDGSCTLYISDVFDFDSVTPGSGFIASGTPSGSYVLFFPIGNDVEDLSVYFCTSEEDAYSIADAFNTMYGYTD